MFYKLIDTTLHYGPHVQYPHGVILHPDITDMSTLPYDGWYYFETEEEAKIFFNIND
jgi:hypothetical protein